MMRLLVGLLGSLACALMSSRSSTLSVAIVRMTRYNSNGSDDSSGQCYGSGVGSNVSHEVVIREGFDWDESLQVSLPS